MAQQGTVVRDVDVVQLGAPGLKPCVRVGEAALREVAAYLLDYNGFAGIPPACLVLCRHSKLNYTVRVPRIESMAVLNREGDAQSAFGMLTMSCTLDIPAVALLLLAC